MLGVAISLADRRAPSLGGSRWRLLARRWRPADWPGWPLRSAADVAAMPETHPSKDAPGGRAGNRTRARKVIAISCGGCCQRGSETPKRVKPGRRLTTLQEWLTWIKASERAWLTHTHEAPHKPWIAAMPVGATVPNPRVDEARRFQSRVAENPVSAVNVAYFSAFAALAGSAIGA